MALRPTNPDRSKELRELERHKAAYAKKGGKVTLLPPLEYTYRLHTVASPGAKQELMLYASKYDAMLQQRQEAKPVKKGFNCVPYDV